MPEMKRVILEIVKLMSQFEDGMGAIEDWIREAERLLNEPIQHVSTMNITLKEHKVSHFSLTTF